MMLLLLVRHALTAATGRRLTGTMAGVELSAEGRDQAARLADRLAAVPLAAVYASPLERCMDTATAIAGPRGLAVRPEPGLIEVGYGRWTGRSIAQVARTGLWKRVHSLPSSVRFPEGETLVEVQGRAVAALEAIAGAHRRAAVAAVTHADVIRLVVAHYAGVHVDLFQRLVVGPASVSAVVIGPDMPRIVRLNDSGRLDDLVPATRLDGGPRGRRGTRPAQPPARLPRSSTRP